jgi:glycosyltransferase involved in cell wall biosynthesis
VSVCIPVYNGADYIAQSVESVLAQSFGDFELIVCDNCSTDDTEAIVRSFSDPRLRYLRNERNLGLVGNANRCLEVAAAEYVCIFHHDDVMLPDNLARKVAVLDAHPGVGFVHSNLLLIDRVGRLVAPEIWAEESRCDYIEGGRRAFGKFVEKMPYASSIFIGAVVARKACYEKVGTFSEQLPHCLDSEMWMRMMLFFDVACLGEPLVKYRVHPTSTSSTWGDYASLPYLAEHYQSVRLVFDRYGGRIPDRRRLSRATNRLFASRAVDVAACELVAGRGRAGRAALKQALGMDASIVGTPGFWKATVASLAGSEGIRLYRKIKTLGKAV